MVLSVSNQPLEHDWTDCMPISCTRSQLSFTCPIAREFVVSSTIRMCIEQQDFPGSIKPVSQLLLIARYVGRVLSCPTIHISVHTFVGSALGRHLNSYEPRLKLSNGPVVPYPVQIYNKPKEIMAKLHHVIAWFIVSWLLCDCGRWIFIIYLIWFNLKDFLLVRISLLSLHWKCHMSSLLNNENLRPMKSKQSIHKQTSFFLGFKFKLPNLHTCIMHDYSESSMTHSC